MVYIMPEEADGRREAASFVLHPVIDAFGPNSSLTVMLVSRLTMRASGRASHRALPRIAPDIGERDRRWNRAVCGLRERHITPRRPHKGFADVRIARMGQDLVDAPSRHDIAAEKQLQRGKCLTSNHGHISATMRQPRLTRINEC